MITPRSRFGLAALLAASMLAAGVFLGSCSRGDEEGGGPEPTPAATEVPTSTAATGEPLLPDLAAGPVTELSVLEAPSGVRFLFFSTSLSNVGDGALRVVATRDGDAWGVEQVIERAGGDTSSMPLDATLAFGDDGTARWLVADLVRYRLTSLDAGGPLLTPPAIEVAVCLDDGTGAEAGCGDEESSSVEMVLEPGARVELDWFDPGQAVDVTGLPAGRYRLEVTVDPHGLFEELDQENDIGAIDFELRPRDGLPPEIVVAS